MQVRFQCPACKGAHVLDMPETTIYMTCGRTGKTLELRVTVGGDVKSRIVGQENEEDTAIVEDE
jgi:hypothetical protein